MPAWRSELACGKWMITQPSPCQILILTIGACGDYQTALSATDPEVLGLAVMTSSAGLLRGIIDLARALKRSEDRCGWL